MTLRRGTRPLVAGLADLSTRLAWTLSRDATSNWLWEAESERTPCRSGRRNRNSDHLDPELLDADPGVWAQLIVGDDRVELVEFGHLELREGAVFRAVRQQHAGRAGLIVGSPLAWAFDGRAGARWALGLAGWRNDFDQAIAMAGAVDPVLQVLLTADFYTLALLNGALLPDATALCDTADALAIAERCGDDSALFMARGARGIVLVHQHGPEREHGFDLLAQVRDAALRAPVTVAVPVVDILTAKERLRSGDLVGAIDLSRAVIDYLFAVGEMIYRGPATTVLVETLLRRSAPGDLQEAQAAIDRLAAVPTEPGFVLHQLPLLRLRALLARAQGDEICSCWAAMVSQASLLPLGRLGRTPAITAANSSSVSWQASPSRSNPARAGPVHIAAHRLAVGARQPGHLPIPPPLQPQPQDLSDFDHRHLPVAHSANTAAEQPEAPKPRRGVVP
jgi:hypothetical protein